MANWFVRKTGSDSNGGSSSSSTPERGGSDVTTNGTTTVTSASASFTAGDVGKGINISGSVYRIASYVDATTITVDRTITAGSSRAWNIGGALLTVTKAVTAPNTVIQPNDSVYIGAGVYRETPIWTLSGTSGNRINVVGDTDGSRTGDSGEVQMTSWLTDDKTTPNMTNSPMHLATASYLNISNLVLIGAATTAKCLRITTGIELTITNCFFLGALSQNYPSVTITPTTAGAKNILIDRCIFENWSTGGGITITLPTVAGADYDANIVFRNCIISTNGTSGVVELISSGALANKGGGVYVYNCTVRGGSNLIRTNSANVSSTYPMRVENSLLISSATALAGFAAGQLVERNNLLYGTALRNANVSVGTGSNSSMDTYAPLLHMGQEKIQGAYRKTPYTPTVGSPILQYGANPTPLVAVDMNNGVRPVAALAAAGALERENNWGREISTVRTGSNASSVTGPGWQDFYLPVDATATTISIWMRYDSSYSGNLPEFAVRNGGEAGVASASVAMTSPANTWQQLSLSFTPTSKGVVTVRLISNSSAASGKVFADDFNVT